MKRLLLLLLSLVIVLGSACVWAFSKGNDQIDESFELVCQQTEDIKAAFQTHKTTLTELQKLTSREDLADATVGDDGYFILGNGERIWIDTVSGDIPTLFTEIGDRQTICFRPMDNDQSFAHVEIYYSKNAMMYTIVYSECDLVQQDNRYQKLDANWYLWTTGMT